MTAQARSYLLTLPGELKNEIFKLALTSNTPIVNPSYTSEPSTPPKHRHTPQLGAALSQTCRTIQDEVDISQLYRNNTFVFTRVAHIHAFRNHLSREQMRWIRGITIDLREAASNYANEEMAAEADVVGNEWLHYLACSRYAHAPGLWCEKLSTLKSDLPDLKELVLDLTVWQSPFAGMRGDGWRYLQRLLGNIKEMESISLKGKCLESKFWNPSPMPWGLAPWFSPAFGNDYNSLLDLLGAGVRDGGDGEKKVFAWSLEDGVTTLEVKILAVNRGSVPVDTVLPRRVPESGILAWEAFLCLGGQQQGDLSAKTPASSSVER